MSPAPSYPGFVFRERLRELELLQREIESTDRSIDRLVYELYGLTGEEIRIVEGKK